MLICWVVEHGDRYTFGTQACSPFNNEKSDQERPNQISVMRKYSFSNARPTRFVSLSLSYLRLYELQHTSESVVVVVYAKCVYEI